MARQFFGTDGIRGTVGQAPITPDFVLRLGHAVGRVLKRSHDKPLVLIGKDTRISGYMLEAALEAGLNSAGASVMLLGPLPTPGVAYLTRAQRAQLGVVISASHNPYPDNGIKFFSAQGTKLPDDWRSYGGDEQSDGDDPRVPAVPVTVGVVTLVRLSVLDEPVSLAAARSGVEGAAGAVASMVTLRDEEATLWLPAASVAATVASIVGSAARSLPATSTRYVP